VSEVKGPEATSQETTATTNFTTTADVVISEVVQFTPLNPVLLTNAETSSEQNIHDFLMKPYRFSSGSLASTDVSSTFTAINLPTALTSVEPYASKLKGFMGMRADITVRLQVNANKFQQGRYILAFCPLVGSGTSNIEVATNMRFANLTTITQLPHVEIDLSLETEAILKIPYVSFMSHLPINPTTPTLNGLLGQLKLFPYSSLVSVAGSTTASYDIYMNFDNIHLAAPVVPQSGKFKPNLVTGEQRSKGVGPIESAATKISRVSNMIGDEVPSLTFLAAPVTWASNLIGGIASVFGWSKPINLGHTQRVITSNAAYMANSDAIDNSYSISVFAQNQVEVLPGFAGNDVDEMSIDFIKSIPAYYKTFTFDTTKVSGDILLDLPLNPSTFETTFVSGTKTVRCQTPLTALTNFFNYYRGGVRLTFKIVKTEFHSGRIALTFNPLAPYQASASISVANAPYVHREIIDIRDGNSFDFVVPYVALTPYRSVNDAFANLTMTVINPLIAPATVSSSITFLLEIAGAPDVEFAVPTNKTWPNPCAVYNPQMSSFIPKADKNSIASSVMGRSQLKHDQFMSARACVGEKVVSILSLLKRNYKFASTYTGNFYLDPFTIFMGETTAAAPNAPNVIDMYSYFSACYALSRGSVRIKVSPNQQFIVPPSATLTMQNSGTFPVVSLGAFLVDPLVPILGSRDLALEIQIPQYNNAHSRSVCDIMGSTAYFTNDHNTLGSSPGVLNVITNVADISSVYRSVGDDFQLGYFVGIPPIYY
jgi:hypothetical protein